MCVCVMNFRFRAGPSARAQQHSKPLTFFFLPFLYHVHRPTDTPLPSLPLPLPSLLSQPSAPTPRTSRTRISRPRTSCVSALSAQPLTSTSPPWRRRVGTGRGPPRLTTSTTASWRRAGRCVGCGGWAGGALGLGASLSSSSASSLRLRNPSPTSVLVHVSHALCSLAHAPPTPLAPSFFLYESLAPSPPPPPPFPVVLGETDPSPLARPKEGRSDSARGREAVGFPPGGAGSGGTEVRGGRGSRVGGEGGAPAGWTGGGCRGLPPASTVSSPSPRHATRDDGARDGGGYASLSRRTAR